MNETPLHEPLIAEEGKEKERVFTGTPERIVNICLASISALIIYWTVYVSADVMWKHGLYIMTVFCMTLVIYPFEKKPKVNHVSLVDWLLIIGSIAGSIAGAFVLTMIPELLRSVGDIRLVLYGAAIVAIIIFAPKGLGGAIEWLDNLLCGKHKKKTEEE